MNSVTLPVFSNPEFARAHHLLATQVSEMMGRKLEESDWAKVYCEAKGIPLAGWSNTDIDIMFGNVGVEQKALARPASQPIKECCGTAIMHPAGTRAFRIPADENPTAAARDILRQYGKLIARRRLLVAIVDRYNNGILDRAEAIRVLREQGGYSQPAADRRIPRIPIPGEDGMKEVDLRTGWLLWQDTLREFLYFEEPMTVPDPARYVAEWRGHTRSGSRISSRNLWIYEEETGEKHFSVTTEAGPKIQPYFRVPNPTDRNLYHFVAQGEDCGNGLTRVWLTKSTANSLQNVLGDLSPERIAAAVRAAHFEQNKQEASGHSSNTLAVEVVVQTSVYQRLKAEFNGVSDEHNFKQLLDVLMV